MHEYNGIIFVDYAASAPYIDINMHPKDKDAYLDGIYFSPHKFLGGPGSAAVLIFNENLYKNIAPDNPGGGTVKWTNPWNERKYYDDVETREDGGTPAFLQTIRTALAIKLKEKMGVNNILLREKELLNIALKELAKVDGIEIFGKNIKDKIGVITFYSDKVHHNLMVKLLNDRFGIQMRGGCSCAGPYGHFLFNIDINVSHQFSEKINQGDSSIKPGWVRLSLHPTLKNEELYFIINAIKDISENIELYKKDYYQEISTGEWFHNTSNFDKERIYKVFEF
jgi:selenocysteine lyase/cysteine desulfurase